MTEQFEEAVSMRSVAEATMASEPQIPQFMTLMATALVGVALPMLAGFYFGLRAYGNFVLDETFGGIACTVLAFGFAAVGWTFIARVTRIIQHRGGAS